MPKRKPAITEETIAAMEKLIGPYIYRRRTSVDGERIR